MSLFFSAQLRRQDSSRPSLLRSQTNVLRR